MENLPANMVCQLDTNTRQVPAILKKILKKAIDPDAIAFTSGSVTDQDILKSSLQVVQNLDEDAQLSARQIASVPSSKTIAIVDRFVDYDETAKHLINARCAFGGKSPYAPDLVLVNEFVKKDLLQALVRQTIASGSQVQQNGSAAARSSRNGGLKSFVSDLKGTYHDSLQVVTEGANVAVLNIQERSAALLQNKVNEAALIVIGVRSLDDAIGYVTKFVQPGNLTRKNGSLTAFRHRENKTYLAAYHFALPESAKYLSQFIPAHISCINQIPVSLLGKSKILFSSRPSLTLYYQSAQQPH